MGEVGAVLRETDIVLGEVGVVLGEVDAVLGEVGVDVIDLGCSSCKV